jgi:glycosyltransferase involved in cell wall biosynthesis
MVFAEAMSFGKPVIGFDLAPINEIVQNGRTGILVDPDDTAGLHDALKTILTDSHLRKNLGAAAKERYEHHFASRVVIKKIVDLHKRDTVAGASHTGTAG